MCYGSRSHTPSLVTVKNVLQGLNNLPNVKVRDLQDFKYEMFEWINTQTYAWKDEIFNHALQHGMPHRLELQSRSNLHMKWKI